MAANDITIIDYKVGSPSQGFLVRVGDKPPLVKVASYLSVADNSGNWAQKVYATFQDAYNAAVRYKNASAPTFHVRADCTLY